MNVQQIKTERMNHILNIRDKYLAVLKHEYKTKQHTASDKELTNYRKLMMQLKHLEYCFTLDNIEDLRILKYVEPNYLSGFSQEKYDTLLNAGHIHNI